jgi:hypothetical protein
VNASYVLHGLNITSDVPLPEPETSFAGPADLVIRRGEPRPVARVPDDVVELRFGPDDDVWYEGSRDGDGWCIRAPGVFTFTTTEAYAIAQPSPDAEEGLLPMLTAGIGISFFLALRGNLCLHASAVEADGRAVALCAPSGFGKSTLAALAAAGACPLIADDVLRIELERSSPPAVYRGASQIRLREGAEALAEHWPGHSHVTTDGRTSVAPPRTKHEMLPLGTVVFPLLDPERDEVAVEKLQSSEAFATLLDCPRLLGWRYPPVILREFDQLTMLAASVPVVVARVPWRMPADPAIGAALIERVLNTI